MILKIKNYWEFLIGKQTECSLEARIFHAISVISITVLFTNVFFDILIGIPALSVLMLIVCLLATSFYYLSRFKGRLSLSIILFNIFSNVLFVANYFLNSGIQGPTLLIFILSIFLNIAIAPKKQYFIWITLNILLVTGLLIADYNYPNLIEDTYLNRFAKYLDLGYSYIVIVLLIIIVTIYIRNSYTIEKQKVEQKAEELKDSNNTKDKLFSILAHDLRAPLSSIQSYLEILNDIDLSEDEKKVIEKDLLSKTKNTSQMLSNLLQWTKAQMEGVSAKLVPVNISECLNVTIHIQQALAKEKDIEIRNELNAQTLIIADPDMLQLVIRNLINNAIKFTPAGGEIIISSFISNERSIIKVQDSGVGITPDQRDKIFTFNSKTSFGTKNEKGVGLGLVLCKEFTERQLGEIWFESELNQGTSFYVSMALAVLS